MPADPMTPALVEPLVGRLEAENVCPKCGEEFRLVWIGSDPPEPYGEVCGCADPDYADARDEKLSNDRESVRDHDHAD